MAGNKRGLGSSKVSPEKRTEIARKGGKAYHTSRGRQSTSDKIQKGE